MRWDGLGDSSESWWERFEDWTFTNCLMGAKGFIISMGIACSIIAGLILWVYIELTRPAEDKARRFAEDFVRETRKVDYEGHTYLWFERGHRAGLCHDENCKCRKWRAKGE